MLNFKNNFKNTIFLIQIFNVAHINFIQRKMESKVAFIHNNLHILF